MGNKIPILYHFSPNPNPKPKPKPKMDSVATHWLVLLAISTIGFYTLSKLIFTFTKWVWCMFLRPPKDLTTYGSWALVTGSTDGIGKAISFELASKGLNLVLVSRNPSRLESTSEEIWGKFGKKTLIKNVVLDFERVTGEEIEVKIRREIEGLDVGVLVNNVGTVAKGARFFDELDLVSLDGLVSVNMGSVNWVTRAVLPGMLERKRGAIVNIGSGSSVAVPSYPLFTIYAATKAYIAMFSRSTSVEYKKHGIDIQCQVPMFVATKLASIKKPSLFVPSPKEFSKWSMRWMGYESLCVPYWIHALQCCIIDALPESLVDRLLFCYFCSIRKRLLAKECRKNSLKLSN